MTANHEGGEGPGAGKADEQEIVDLKTLRAIRVLRPLKLVSGVPSKSQSAHNNGLVSAALHCCIRNVSACVSAALFEISRGDHQLKS